MPFESDLPVYLCRGLKVPLKELWPNVKKYLSKAGRGATVSQECPIRIPYGSYDRIEMIPVAY